MTAPGFCNACGVPAPAEALRCGSCGALLPPRDDPGDPRRVAHTLAERLGRAGLRDADGAVRNSALETLAASRRREAVPDLASALASGREAEQVRAAEALGRLGVPEALPPLRAAVGRRGLLGLRIPPVAKAALAAIAWVQGRDAAAALEELKSGGGRLAALARRAVDRRS